MFAPSPENESACNTAIDLEPRERPGVMRRFERQSRSLDRISRSSRANCIEHLPFEQDVARSIR